MNRNDGQRLTKPSGATACRARQDAVVKFDTTKLARNQMGSAPGGASPQDPAQVLGYLQAASTVTKVGAGSVNGTATTEYGAMVDVAKLAAAEGASGQQLAQLKHALGTNGDGTVVCARVTDTTR